MQIGVGCAFYEDYESLKRMIDSCWQNIDLMFMIDGKYANYQDVKPLSSFKTREMVKGYANTILVDIPNLKEHDKRQVYLELCKEYHTDYLLIIDSDEYVHPKSDWDKFRKEIRDVCNDDYIYNLKNYTDMGIGFLLPLDQPRLWRNPGELYYMNGHHYMFAKKGGTEPLVPKTTLYSVKLCHDPHLRTNPYKIRHDNYKLWLQAYERERMRHETDLEKRVREVCVWYGC